MHNSRLSPRLFIRSRRVSRPPRSSGELSRPVCLTFRTSKGFFGSVGIMFPISRGSKSGSSQCCGATAAGSSPSALAAAVVLTELVIVPRLRFAIMLRVIEIACSSSSAKWSATPDTLPGEDKNAIFFFYFGTSGGGEAAETQRQAKEYSWWDASRAMQSRVVARGIGRVGL